MMKKKPAAALLLVVALLAVIAVLSVDKTTNAVEQKTAEEIVIENNAEQVQQKEHLPVKKTPKAQNTSVTATAADNANEQTIESLPKLWGEGVVLEELADHPAALLASTRWIELDQQLLDQLLPGDSLALPVGNQNEVLVATVDSIKQGYGGDSIISMSLENDQGMPAFALITRGASLTLVKIRNGGRNYSSRINNRQSGGWLVFENELRTIPLHDDALLPPVSQ